MSLPSTMRAVVQTGTGGPDTMVLGERPVPKPGDGEVLIKVAAAGINRADTMQREGQYRLPPNVTDLMGLECSGTVAAIGPGVTNLKVGDAVCALLNGGGYAEYVTTAAPLCMPVPKGYDMVKAGALPETFFTVWDAIFMRCKLKRGESILVHGGSSGIGTTTIALAKEFGASKIFATARGPEKGAAIKKIGCDRPIDYTTEDFVEVIEKEMGGNGVDVILDMVGKDYVARNLKCLAMDGRHFTVATMSGPKVEIDMRVILFKRLTVTGAGLRVRTVAQKAEIADELRAKVWPVLDAGRLQPLVHVVLPLEKAAEGHRIMEASTHIGKIMLKI